MVLSNVGAMLTARNRTHYDCGVSKKSFVSGSFAVCMAECIRVSFGN